MTFCASFLVSDHRPSHNNVHAILLAAAYMSTKALNCVVDFICALVPFFALRHVQIDRRTKIGVFTILGCGLVTASCSIGRAVTLDFESPDETCSLNPLLQYHCLTTNPKQPPDALIPYSYWLDGELFGAIIFASLPAIRQLFTHYMNHGTFRRSTGKRSYQSRRTFPISTNSKTEVGTGMKKMHGREEIGRQTDVYVELDDVDDMGNITPGKNRESLEDLRRHVGAYS